MTDEIVSPHQIHLNRQHPRYVRNAHQLRRELGLRLQASGKIAETMLGAYTPNGGTYLLTIKVQFASYLMKPEPDERRLAWKFQSNKLVGRGHHRCHPPRKPPPQDGTT